MAIDPREFRNCLGRFATGITIITTELDGEVHGMTANSFTSVSIAPALILVAVGHKTKLHQILPQSRRYGVSILDESQMALSNHFAGQPDESLAVPFVRQHDMNLITGAIAHLVGYVVDMHDAGDHTLYIAEVDYLNYRDGRPLLYYGGGYQQLQVQLQAFDSW